MKVHIGQTIYCLYDCQITLEEVGYIGVDSFILKHYDDYRTDCRELYYEEYNKTWFRSLEKAKVALLKTRKGKGYFVAQVANNCWELFASSETLEDTIDTFKKQLK